VDSVSKKIELRLVRENDDSPRNKKDPRRKLRKAYCEMTKEPTMKRQMNLPYNSKATTSKNGDSNDDDNCFKYDNTSDDSKCDGTNDGSKGEQIYRY
ncbi:14827_t:CDS:2, partial [Gigaspora margarita]